MLLKLSAPCIFACLLTLTASARANEAQSSNHLKNCETVPAQERIVANEPAQSGSTPDTLRAHHPMRVRVPVEPCEPPRKRQLKDAR